MKPTLICSFCLYAFIALFTVTAQAEDIFGFEVEIDVVYAQGAIAPNGTTVMRDLMMDVYTPSVRKNDALPAVILVHGGAYHRGGRRQPPFREAGAVHSSMEDYARLLTPLGFVCFVIDYRLAPELPVAASKPGTQNLLPLDTVVTTAGLARANFARSAMKLPVLADNEKIILWNADMAGAEDTFKAVEFVRANAKRFGIAADKIALGGHSAGGGNTVNAAFGMKADVAAVFPLSPAPSLYKLDKVITGNTLPPTLLMTSQYDLEAVSATIPETIARLKSSNSDAQLVWVPGFPHFYPTGAVSLGDDGTRTSVGERVTAFLQKYLK